MSPIKLTAKASRLAAKGRIWFYGDDLQDNSATHGALLRVRGAAGEDLGLGFFSERSKLALRLCGGSGAGEADLESFLHGRIAASLQRREGMEAEAGALRLVHGDSDGLPGLVVDRYADCLILQITAAALEVHLNLIVSALNAELSPRMILARNDLAVRKLEGLSQQSRLLHGRRCERVEILEDGIRHEIDLFHGHKTGFYLDQRPARALLRRLAKGRRVLDLFSYQGAFSLAVLAGGAQSALAVDQSQDALSRAEEAARRNALSGLQLQQANVFDLLREMRKSESLFDLVVLDPPAFAKNRRQVQGGVRGYRDLNRQAMRLLARDGLLLTCSCSHHVSATMFEDTLRQAARKLPFRMMIRERLSAGVDHPVRLDLPESEYLKVLLLQRVDSP